MKLVDANLLIYAINQDAPAHDVARAWIEDCFSNSESVGLPWLVLLAFLRLTTHPRVFQQPLKPETALRYVEDWLALPNVSAVNPGEAHATILARLLRDAGTAGNLTSDAHLAAIAIECGAVLYSADNDFKRFAGLKHINPLASGGVHESTADYR